MMRELYELFFKGCDNLIQAGMVSWVGSDSFVETMAQMDSADTNTMIALFNIYDMFKKLSFAEAETLDNMNNLLKVLVESKEEES